MTWKKHNMHDQVRTIQTLTLIVWTLTVKYCFQFELFDAVVPWNRSRYTQSGIVVTNITFYGWRHTHIATRSAANTQWSSAATRTQVITRNSHRRWRQQCRCTFHLLSLIWPVFVSRYGFVVFFFNLTLHFDFRARVCECACVRACVRLDGLFLYYY